MEVGGWLVVVGGGRGKRERNEERNNWKSIRLFKVDLNIKIILEKSIF